VRENKSEQSPEQVVPTIKSERSARNAEAPTGMEATDTLQRAMANGAPPQPDERETSDFPMRSPESSDIRRRMTVPEPEHHAERNLTPWAQVFSPKPSSLCKLRPAPIQFRATEDVPNAVVLSARPALPANGFA
jgi:hypothetical protein